MNVEGHKHSDHSFFHATTCYPIHWVTLASLWTWAPWGSLVGPHVAMLPTRRIFRNLPLKCLMVRSSEPCGVKSFLLEDVGISCIYPSDWTWPWYPLLTQPRQESEMGTRTLSRASLLSIPNRRSTQGKIASPDPLSVVPASRSLSSTWEICVWLAMSSMALMSFWALFPCNITALSRWVLSSIPASF